MIRGRLIHAISYVLGFLADSTRIGWWATSANLHRITLSLSSSFMR